MYYGVNGKTFQKQYKSKLSDFNSWEKRSHSTSHLVYPENIGPFLALDETSLSNGELYTILTNKEKRGKKGSLVAIIKGVRSEDIIKQIREQIPEKLRKQVKEVSVDMANSMNLIVRRCFSKAQIVIDRFHVQKLASEAVQSIRIRYRWDAFKTENELDKIAKANNQKREVELFPNGESRKQLLARARYLLYMPCNKWSLTQETRANILFTQYPEIEKAYKLAQKLTYIYEQAIHKDVARVKLAKWFNEIEDEASEEFDAIKNTVMKHYENILNYYNNRSTNAQAEAFNAKIKDFRRTFRGVRDREFFLFRLTKIYA